MKAFPRISETFIINEILELERQGFDLHIYALNHPADTWRHRLADQVRSPITYLPEPLIRALPSVLTAHGRLALRFPVRYMSAMRRVLTSWDLDLIVRFVQTAYLIRLLDRDRIAHLHAGFVHAPGSVAWLTHIITGRSFSVATHAQDLYRSQPGLLAHKLAAARVVFTCTQYNVAYLREVGSGAATIRRLYHGTDLGRFQFGDYGGTNPPLVLAVARLVEKKGLDDLIRACAILRDRHRRLRCRIIGSGVLQQRLERLIREQSLEGIVSLEGALDQDDVLAWYRQATVMVLPSLVTPDGDRDGIPNVLVEAAACGVPIVSTDVSGIPELIRHGDTGLLAPPRDATALADAIDRLLQSSQLREVLRTNARALVVEKFDLRRNAMAIGQVLEQVMGAAPPNGVPAGELLETGRRRLA